MSLPCKTCKFADWDRTASGRLSPKGRGKCTWRKEVRVSASIRVPYNAFGSESKVVFNGGIIWRNDTDFTKCPTYLRADQ